MVFKATILHCRVIIGRGQPGHFKSIIHSPCIVSYGELVYDSTVCLPVYPFIYLSIILTSLLYRARSPSVCPFIYLYLSVYIYLSIILTKSVYLSIYIDLFISIYLYLFIYHTHGIFAIQCEESIVVFQSYWLEVLLLCTHSEDGLKENTIACYVTNFLIPQC